MTIEKGTSKISSAIQDWIITLSLLFFSLFSIVFSLICIYSLPDHSVKPFEGGLFFMGGALVLVALVIFRWKKEKEILPNNQIVVKETVSDKIIKWITILYCFGYSSLSFVIALICIYSLPDKTIQPKTGIIYSLGGVVIVTSFVVVVMKNWTNKNP